MMEIDYCGVWRGVFVVYSMSIMSTGVSSLNMTDTNATESSVDDQEDKVCYIRGANTYLWLSCMKK